MATGGQSVGTEHTEDAAVFSNGKGRRGSARKQETTGGKMSSPPLLGPSNPGCSPRDDIATFASVRRLNILVPLSLCDVSYERLEFAASAIQ